MNYSAWNSARRKRRNPALAAGHVITEFRNRVKKSRIFAHKLGSIDFSERKDVNANRQRVIDIEIGNIDIDGFRYKNVGHVYSEEVVIGRNAGEYSYEILAHGHPMGGTTHAGMENCVRSGLQCANGEGTDYLCNPGKCIIGTLERVNNNKWKYTSKNTYSPANTPVVYYLPAGESVELKTVLRGKVSTYSPSGASTTVSVNKPASAYSVVFLPPKFYHSEDFLDSVIIHTDSRLSHVINKPSIQITGIEDRKSRFARNILMLAYPDTSEGYLNNRLNNTATEEIRDSLVDAFSTLNEKWSSRCNSIITEEFSYRYANLYTGLDLICVVYDRVKELLESVIQVTESSLSTPTISFNKDSVSRPVYGRLPGITEGYRSDPAFSDNEKPSQWLTSGTDEFLSAKKEAISAFYADFLDPDTCNPAILDWLAQHVGLFGDLWNPLWSTEIKKAFIRNAFGWWDREAKTELPGLGEVLTPKGANLEKFPFTNPEWVSDPTTLYWDESSLGWGSLTSWGGQEDNFLKVKFDEIETLYLDNGQIQSDSLIKLKIFSETTNKVSVISTDGVRIDKSLWNGLIESKGSLLGVAFLSSIFGLKAHTPNELEIVDLQRKIVRPRSGLRNAEINAPLLLPFKLDPIQVGTISDAEVNNYTNQLVAGVSRVTDLGGSRNVFFRVPYYYNRDGKSWDRVSYIAKNWMPSNLNVRVQYPYLSANLWAVGDAFFNLEVIDESIYSTSLLTTEDEGYYFTTEDGIILNYD